MAPLRLTKIVRDLPLTVPFVGPEALERANGIQIKARLGANESSFGPSPKAIAAMVEAARENWKYSDPENHGLRTAIAAHHGVSTDNVMVGEGIDGLLGLTIRLLIEPGETVVTSDGAYPTFNAHVASGGGRLVKVPMRHDLEDLNALLQTAKSEQARLIYVSNPNNPMGTFWSAEAIETLCRNLPGETGLILDEAYADTAPPGTAPPINCELDQVLRYRTFSKAYGLAGARIGYVIGPSSLIPAFDKVRNHYGINRVGQLGALEALKDQAYLQSAVRQIAEARSQLAAVAVRHGLQPIPSGANFVAIDCGEGSEKSDFIQSALLRAGVFVRRPSVAPLNRCIRVSCGSAGQIEIFADALSAALNAWRQHLP